MGQYFKLVNVDTKEVAHLPGGMKAIERVTNPLAMGMIGYLLLEGPQDGTVFSRRASKDDPNLEEAIEELKTREKEQEEERFEQYLSGERDYARNKFERAFETSPEDDPENFEKFCRDESRSTYRKNTSTLHWRYDRLSTVAAANLDINEANEFAGRWAGDDVRLVGDYAENELYDDSRQDWVYEHDGEEFVNYATSSAPIKPSSISREDIVHSVVDREVEPGDLCHIKHPDLEEKVYAHYVGPAENEWNDITDGLKSEFVEFVGEDWVEGACENTLMRPDMVLTA